MWSEEVTSELRPEERKEAGITHITGRVLQPQEHQVQRPWDRNKLDMFRKLKEAIETGAS